jgi:zinc/manganese transport system substrate-binding protein
VGSKALAAAAALLLAACSTASAESRASDSGGSKVIQVVAAENFWGSIVSQLGGTHVEVTNIIDSPDADPHDYEPSTSDGRAIASADFVLINGVGYDGWASKLVAANPSSRRIVLTVGDLIGVADNGNPHRWYNPDDVQRVVDQVLVDLRTLDPADAAYFDQEKTAFETSALADYTAVIANIKAKYAGTPVGASESIFAMLAPAVGLDLITPPDFLKAISQGTEPTAADKATIDEQIKDNKIKVYVYNSQNATPDIQAQVAEARAEGIPVTAITETMTPATASWEQWQTAQLDALRDALAQGTAR